MGFRFPWAVFRILNPRIPGSTSKNFTDSGIRIPLHETMSCLPNVWRNHKVTELTLIRWEEIGSPLMLPDTSMTKARLFSDLRFKNFAKMSSPTVERMSFRNLLEWQGQQRFHGDWKIKKNVKVRLFCGGEIVDLIKSHAILRSEIVLNLCVFASDNKRH